MERKNGKWLAVVCSVLSLLIIHQQTSGQSSYRETYRPQFHFSPAKNWINDPCGTIYYDGVYHMFYQYNPAGDQWGNMSWGHAVSDDLVHWEERRLSLYRDPLGDIFTGSAVIDKNNTAGFGANALVAIFTHAGTTQRQSIASSLDNGVSFTKYENNPVLLNNGIADFRDPQVFWHEGSSKWIMTLAVKDRIHIYSSGDLKAWELKSEFGSDYGSHAGVWECPDLFPLKISETGEEKWVLMISINPGGPAGGSAMQYFIGDFDGIEFILDPWFADALKAKAPSGTVFEDFESGYDGWAISGTAFGSSPAAGAFPDQQQVTGFLGNGLVNTYISGDLPLGKLTSPDFQISSSHINFLLGGGMQPGLAEIRLVVNNEIVVRTTGENDERLRWTGWDVSPWSGLNAHIEIVDEVTGGWGHINVDHIVFSNELATDNSVPAFWVDGGPDFYAGRTWVNKPEGEEPRVWVSWMSNWAYASAIPTYPWRGSMSLPRSLGLKSLDGKSFLTQAPVKALQELRIENSSFALKQIGDANEFMSANNISGKHYELEFTIDPGNGDEGGIHIRSNGSHYTKIGFNQAENIIFVDRGESGFIPFGANVQSVFKVTPLSSSRSAKLQVFVDDTALEVFINNGERVITTLIFPLPGMEEISFYQTGTDATISNLNFWQMESAWKNSVTSAEAPTSQAIEVYPNPSQGIWNVLWDQPIANCQLFDSHGKQINIFTSLISPTHAEIKPKHTLKDGLYFLKVYGPRNSFQTLRVLVVN